ncbi:GLYCINE-RICH CELL WALL STRUCTURAL PROTEIN 1.8-LIKE [Salix viminalis]|uniref:GLYCINE-RICH CELL WALL STRUCTURAL PROTEIN 1.8-LIKE n=1 Tax=Salix viminalis TaxID=40686 RepID=A0A9Q0UHC2_SALVM|nr:GLYCINE-RICH CELL WALL STRUCTURAL PROTEIN 1.8-LIKE [Salix viminalis]
MAAPKPTKTNPPKQPQNPPPPKQPQTPSSETTTKAISWADRVKVTDSTTRYTLDHIPQRDRDCQLEITDDMLTEHAEQWSRCMVGFFPGYRMNYHAVNKIASRVWRSHGLEDVRTTAAGFIIFRFKTVDQMLELLERGPWLFGGKAIILQQWHPHFIFDKSKISKIPVWVRIHGLPFPLWSRKGLSLVASKVGRPLACDEATFTCSRLDFARVCVEIDAASPFIHNFSVLTPLSQDPLNIEVEFEWKPTRCAKCCLFGHSCSRGGDGKAIDEVPSGGVVQVTAAELGTLDGKPSHVKVQGGAATQGTSDKSSHAEMSEGHAKADESQVPGHRPVVPRGKGSQDRTVCPSGKDMHPGNATSTKVGKPSLLAGPSQEPARQTRSQSESSMNSKTEDSHAPIYVSIAKKPDKGKATIKDIESSEEEEITGKGIHPKGMVNTMASFHSQPCDSEEDLEVDSRQVHSDQNDMETSFMAFAKVKKKKGGSWNIRGLNGHNKQKEVREWIFKNQLGMVGLLETKVLAANQKAVEEGLQLQSWSYITNGQQDGRARIMVGWDTKKFQVICVSIDQQWITCTVNSLATNMHLTVTFVYGMHTPADRQRLWDYITMQSSCTPLGWTLMGDFNATLKASDSSGGDPHWVGHKLDFGRCLEQAELTSLPYRGLRYTWHNGQGSTNMIIKKLDWCNGVASSAQ